MDTTTTGIGCNAHQRMKKPLEYQTIQVLRKKKDLNVCNALIDAASISHFDNRVERTASMQRGSIQIGAESVSTRTSKIRESRKQREPVRETLMQRARVPSQPACPNSIKFKGRLSFPNILDFLSLLNYYLTTSTTMPSSEGVYPSK
jgi:hypothetical protein